jgi:ligand-binding sensor domain-containing protein
MIQRIYLFLILIFLISCEKNDMINNFPGRVRFDISGRLLEGKRITSIATDARGNYCIASDKELYYTINGNQKNYSLDFPVLDLAIAPDETVWIGTRGGGLGHLSGKVFTWYTGANAGLPRDYVSNVEIAPDGNVWFNSSAFNLGGLGVYNGEKFEFFTPENSPLNQNMIDDIEIGPDGAVYIATSGTVGKTNVYRISDGSWDCLGNEKGTFYWIFSFTIGPSGSIYLIEDFSLSSSWPNSNKFYEFRDNNWQIIKTDNSSVPYLYSPIKADNRNYCWIPGFGDKSFILHVYDGKSWINSPDGIFPDDFITAIETDSENNIWIGTYKSGVFILNQ